MKERWCVYRKCQDPPINVVVAMAVDDKAAKYVYDRLKEKIKFEGE